MGSTEPLHACRGQTGTVKSEENQEIQRLPGGHGCGQWVLGGWEPMSQLKLQEQ